MIGVDIVKVSRIVEMLEHPRFLQKVFTDKEIEYIEKRNRNPETVAGLYAAKEAISKVFGTGIGIMSFHDVEIRHDTKGQPFVLFQPNARQMLDDRKLANIELSISHEKEFATAVAVGIEKSMRSQRLGALKVYPELTQSMLTRDRKGYKGNYGRVAIVGGGVGMAGSVCLAAQAALRTGSGLVYLVVPKSIAEIVQIKMTEAITIPIEDEGTGRFLPQYAKDVIEAIQGFDAVGIGPGLKRGEGTAEWMKEVFTAYKGRMVIDADALNLVSEHLELLKLVANRAVLTPHEMEMSRLTGYPVEHIRQERPSVATEFASKHRVITVLKGADSVITDGLLYFLNNTGNPGMATAGSGDALTGMIASFLGYGYKTMLSARLGCYIHGVAGDLSKARYGEDGMIASDIVKSIPYAVKQLKELTGEADD